MPGGDGVRPGSVVRCARRDESSKNPPGASRFFTVRTTEKDADLVQVSVDRLLSEEKDKQLDSLLKSIQLKSFAISGKTAALEFSDFASPGYLKLFLEREFKLGGLGEQAFDLRGDGKSQESRYKNMTLEVTTAAYDPAKDRTKLEGILKQTQTDFGSRPQPERLEKFDAQLASETSARAKFRNCGQVCIAPSRFYVHKDVQKKFTEAAVEFAKGLKLGNGLESGVESRGSRRGS
jgi:hypothetical protein